MNTFTVQINITPWCDKCITGSGKKKGHTGPHKKFSVAERKRNKKESNRNDYVKRCRRSRQQESSLQKMKSMNTYRAHLSMPITYPHVPIMPALPLIKINVFERSTQNNHLHHETTNPKKIITNITISKQDHLEESCFSKFHKHFHPDVNKNYPLNELIRITHHERLEALYYYEQDIYHHLRGELQTAIPDMSRVLGNDPWEYSDFYSSKRTMKIYIYFLSYFLYKHKQIYITMLKSRDRICTICESQQKYSIMEQEYRSKVMGVGRVHGCFNCRSYICKTCETKTFFKELYRDLHKVKLFFTMTCTHCVKGITKLRFRAREQLRMYQQKKRRFNIQDLTNRYGDLLYFYIPDSMSSSVTEFTITSPRKPSCKTKCVSKYAQEKKNQMRRQRMHVENLIYDEL